ncbi:DHA2 family efflux MFS transporter permease subunit [Cellulomonas sp. Root137]|uniref:DHA2 family efflux MFS transporter permease subunit n=1 Tax=Cellulomonas sp. Root137 TaxID=1736459 RepID=UPI000700F407|nr:DHA2 family efflux MFS transporter permease subunit [Cellulomonas sp. Root137]KQY44561.1 MFS transporter [Cellulomonas sp. Root137]
MTSTGVERGVETVTLGSVARFGLLVGPVLSMLDSSVVNVAVPVIADDLGAGLREVQWVVSGYLLALGLSLAATSYLARRFGTLRVYTVSAVAFVVVSAGCALAPSVGVLIGLRVAQGLAGAPLVPLALSILLGSAGARRSAIPVSAALVLFLAPALGPTLGGLLLVGGHWEWIFLVNAPIGALGVAALLRVPRGVGSPADPHVRFDPAAFAVLATGLVLALFGAVEGTASGWAAFESGGSLVAGLALLATYMLWAPHRPHPPVDLAMVRERRAALGLGLQVICSVVAFGTVFLMPVFTESVQGHTAMQTGLALLPQGVLMGVGTWAGQRLAPRVPLRTLVTGGFVGLAAASLLLLTLELSTPLWVVAAILSGRAVAVGLVTTPLLVAMLAPLTESQLADGNTLFSIVQRVGGSVGVSLLAATVAGATTRALAVDRFHVAGAVLIALAALAAVGSLFLGEIGPARPTAELPGGSISP